MYIFQSILSNTIDKSLGVKLSIEEIIDGAVEEKEPDLLASSIMAETLDCEFDTCSWTSPKGDLATVVKLYEMHLKVKHSSVQNVSKPEKAKRPDLAAEMSDEDWMYFTSRWAEYKKATGLSGDDIITQLMECCHESIRRDYHRTFSRAVGEDDQVVTEAQRLQELKQLAVRKKNKAVNRVKLGTLKQDKGEPIRKFAGRVKSLAAVSEYLVKCKGCKKDVSYSEEVIMDQVIRGLAMSDIQKDVLSHMDADTLTLDKLLTFVEGKESGQASQGLLSGGAAGSGNAVIPDQKCGFCGESHKRGKQFCKAGDHKCDCGRTGHFPKMCRSKGKPFKSDEKDAHEKKETKKANTAQQVEAAWGYPDSNWACQVDIEKSFQLPESINFIEKYPENKNSLSYFDCFTSKRDIENIKIAGSPTHGKAKVKREKKKAGPPTHCKFKAVMQTVMLIMAGTAIRSTIVDGDISPTQSALSTQASASTQLSHHIYSKQHGWVKKGAMDKPMVTVQAKVDIPAYLTLRIRVPNLNVRPATGPCLADTGASICLAGKQFMRSLGMNESHLTPCDMSVTGANSASIKVMGAMLVEFSSKQGNNTSKQVVYVCEGVSGALLSLEACIDLGLVTNSFPHVTVDSECNTVQTGKKSGCECSCPVRATAPDIPKTLPFKPVEDNIKKLDTWIKDYYAASAFNCCECQPLPRMHGEPLKIHMKDGVKPVASHSPIPIPLHWQAKVKAGLDRDEAIGVIEKVPPGTPTTWCHRMVVVPKKDNTPRRTVNFQPLNEHSSRQTHHTMSPFHQASMVPAGTKKTVLDAWNGYHSVYLDPTCRDLTTFITPWGRYTRPPLRATWQLGTPTLRGLIVSLQISQIKPSVLMTLSCGLSL